MANTTNLNLVKPAGTDYALVSVINGNMDIIDSKVGAVPSNASVQGQIDTLNNQMAKTAFKADARMSANQSKVFSFSNYVNTAIFFGATSNSDGCLYIFSNGYLLPIKTSTNISFSLASDYKTITVTNNSSGNIDIGCISTLLEITVS